jgi:hypothetical protein
MHIATQAGDRQALRDTGPIQVRELSWILPEVGNKRLPLVEKLCQPKIISAGAMPLHRLKLFLAAVRILFNPKRLTACP